MLIPTPFLMKYKKTLTRIFTPRPVGPEVVLSVISCAASARSLLATVDPVTNNLASARQKSRWSHECFFAVKFAGAAAGSMSG